MEAWAFGDQGLEDFVDEAEAVGPLIVVPWVVLVHAVAKSQLLLNDSIDENQSHFFLFRRHLGFVFDDALIFSVSSVLTSSGFMGLSGLQVFSSKRDPATGLHTGDELLSGTESLDEVEAYVPLLCSFSHLQDHETQVP